MMRVLSLLMVLALLSCATDDDTSAAVGGSSGSVGGGSTTTGSAGGMAVGTGGGAGGAGGAGGGGGQATSGDPNVDGPYAIDELDDSTLVSATGNTVDVHAAFPRDAAGPFPVVLIGHGFQLPPSQYYGYARRLATFGYVALTVDFVAGFTPNNVANAQELIHGLTWLELHPMLASKADVNNVGATGHSLGGKVALLAATMDARIKASITLDPVDGSMNCSPQNCPDVSELLPIAIPTAFLGETIDATGGFMACAPAAHNFTTFFANAAAPALAIDVLGANHMSFLDDVSSCGFTCSFCNAASVVNAVVNDLARAFVVAFYERHLKGNVDYDAYLTGPQAQQRYVDTALVTITTK